MEVVLVLFILCPLFYVAIVVGGIIAVLIHINTFISNDPKWSRFQYIIKATVIMVVLIIIASL